MKKKTVLCNDSSLRGESSSVLFVVSLQGYKRDFKDQNICNLQLSGFVIISEFFYCCEGDQQPEEIFRKSETRKIIVVISQSTADRFRAEERVLQIVTFRERKIRVIFLTGFVRKR